MTRERKGAIYLMRFAVAAAALAAAALAIGPGHATEKETGIMVVAQASDSYQLFKVISAKDEIIIGLSEDDQKTIGKSDVLGNLARKLADSGQITYWQFSTRKAKSGDLELAALQRVAIMKSDAVRIEPYKTTLKVVPPAK